MAIYYIDPTWNGTESGTEAEPYSAWATPTLAGNNTYLQKRGTTAKEQVTLTSLDNVNIGAYGTGAVPIIDGELTRDYGLLIEACNNTIVEDIQLSNALINCLRVTGLNGTWTGPYLNNTFNRVITNGCLQATTPRVDVAAAGTGFLIYAQTNYNPGSLNGVTVNDCISYNNAFHGFDTRNKSLNVTYNNCTSYGNGTHVGAHNFSTHPSAFLTTWTSQGAGVYSATESANDDYQYIVDSANAGFYLTRNDGAGASPAAGEWSKVSKTIYVHLIGDVDPATGAGLFVVRAEMGPVIYNNCTAYACKELGVLEGHGFCSDDSSYGVYWNNCNSYGNEGHGFKTRFNIHIHMSSCLSTGNNRSGFRADGANESVDIINSSFIGNGENGIQHEQSRNCDVINNIVKGNGILDPIRGGIKENTGSVSCTIDYNLTYNNVAFEIENESGSNNINSNPMLDSNYIPDVSSPCYRAGMGIDFGTRDYQGNKFKTPPSIGAYELAAPRMPAKAGRNW